MKLLLAYDGSPGSQAAVADLQRAGLPRSGEILVLSVVDVWMPPAQGPADPSLPGWLTAPGERARQRVAKAVENARASAEEAARRLRAAFPDWKVNAEGCADSPAWALIRKAEQWKADLLVLGSRGHGGLEHVLLGSVVHKVMADAPCSVRIARPRPRENTAAPRILVAVDGSLDSEAALQSVVARVWPAGSEIRLVTAIEPTLVLPGSPVLLWVKPTDPEERTWVQRMLEAWAQKARSAGLSTSHIVKEGDPKHVLVAEAQQWGADCIFLGARGLRRIERFLLGSVSLAVAMRAPCSVEMVRPKLKANNNPVGNQAIGR